MIAAADPAAERPAPPDVAHWRCAAADWIAWARTPGVDAFWAYRAALAGFVGRGDGRAALDVGCGEGRVSRLLGEVGFRVTAVDPAAPLLAAAETAGSAETYRLAPAHDLPFPDASFDLVMAYNMLMDVEDVPRAVAEMRRVLRSAGTLLVSIVHPFADRGRFDAGRPEAPFVLRGSYFGRERFESVEERSGLRMSFAGWSQPLESYAAALERAGLAIVSLREPVPDAGADWDGVRNWSRLPLFLWLKARPLLATGSGR